MNSDMATDNYESDFLIEYKFTSSNQDEEGRSRLLHNNSWFFKDPVWEIREFTELKESLNAVKSSLNDKDVDEWGKHTTFTDESSFLISEVKSRLKVPPSLLTGAWLKFYQILDQYQLLSVPRRPCQQQQQQQCSKVRMKALFLCEAPGGFVNATNHYVKSNFSSSLSLDWIASSLNPYHEGTDYVSGTAIVDDRFIRCSTSYDNWFFGSDNTGDIFKPSFFKSLKEKLKESGKEEVWTGFDLITGDGGISCIDFPDRQESLSFPLALNETLTALNCLKKSGSLVIKLFSLLEIQTVCLTYLLRLSFEELIACKPFASKRGNSEIYLVCKNYKESPELKTQFSDLLALLHSKCDQSWIYSNRALLPRQLIPDAFLAEALNCGRLFKNKQESTIQRNLELFRNLEGQQRKAIVARKKYLARKFIQVHNLQSVLTSSSDSICSQLEIESNKLEARRFNFFGIHKCINVKGSYNKRKLDNEIGVEPIRDALNNIYDVQTLEELFGSWILTNDQNISSNRGLSLSTNFIYGQSFNEIKCSKFCDITLLTLFNKLTKEDQRRHHLHHSKLSSCRRLETLVKQSIKCLISEYLQLSSRKPVNQMILVDYDASDIANFFSSLIKDDLQNQALELDCLTFEKFDERIQTRTSPDASSLLANANKLTNGHLNRRLFLLDPLVIHKHQTQLTSEPKLARHSTLAKLIHNLVRVLELIREDDLLIIHLSFHQCLQRTTVALMHLLSMLSTRMSVVPCLVSNLLGKNLLCSSVERQVEGQLYMFASFTPLRGNQGERIEVSLKSILAETQSVAFQRPSQNMELLELTPVPNILQDTVFYNTLYNANVVHATEALKIITGSYTEAVADKKQCT